MLETLVPSKIRRTLLEHLLIHPDERFYLRGLAKELTLPISPVRRELLRLEQLSLLNAYDEANIRFYAVRAQGRADPARLPALSKNVSGAQAGEMRSARWRLLPGTVGGFSQAVTSEGRSR